MGKLFLRIWREEGDHSGKMIGYKDIELVLKNFTESELLGIKRKLGPLRTVHWPVYETPESSVIISLGEITTSPEEGSSHVIYSEVTVKREHNLEFLKFSRNGKSAYISDFNSPDVAINLILKLILETTCH